MAFSLGPGGVTPVRAAMKTTPAGRPYIGRTGTRVPLTPSSPEEWWQEEADRLGLSVEDYKAQVALADSILEELFSEEA